MGRNAYCLDCAKGRCVCFTLPLRETAKEEGLSFCLDQIFCNVIPARWCRPSGERQQAFFPDKSAWEKLARALKGSIEEGAFNQLSGTVSLPFKPGERQTVAVKVIDPRGNEVMRVHRLGAVRYDAGEE